jgi:hypothetical protein
MEPFKITIDEEQKSISKTDPQMLNDLEFAYNPIEQKVRDLQEYL